MKLFLALFLYLVADKPMDSKADLWKPARALSAPVQPVATASARDQEVRRFTYVFEGQAVTDGKPCAGASVSVRVITSVTHTVAETVTNNGGYYSVTVSAYGKTNEPISWEMMAYTADHKLVDHVGRHIVMREDDTIVVRNPVEFVSL
jgi:hypothetical protein